MGMFHVFNAIEDNDWTWDGFRVNENGFDFIGISVNFHLNGSSNMLHLPPLGEWCNGEKSFEISYAPNTSHKEI